jgi:hypothetical protein
MACAPWNREQALVFGIALLLETGPAWLPDPAAGRFPENVRRRNGSDRRHNHLWFEQSAPTL